MAINITQKKSNLSNIKWEHAAQRALPNSINGPKSIDENALKMNYDCKAKPSSCLCLQTYT